MFELVEDAGLVAGAINFFVFRGRVRHALKRPRAVWFARRIGMFDAAYGPTRFFFGELFSSDATGAPRNLGMHGRNDEHAAAVGRWLVARDGFDFLLYYLPEVDMAQHRVGPDAAVDAVERADAAVSALVEAAGGLERFLERYASSSSPTTGSRRCTRPSSCGRRSPTCPSSSPRCARSPPTARSRWRRRTARR